MSGGLEAVPPAGSRAQARSALSHDAPDRLLSATRRRALRRLSQIASTICLFRNCRAGVGRSAQVHHAGERRVPQGGNLIHQSLIGGDHGHVQRFGQGQIRRVIDWMPQRGGELHGS